MFLIILLAGISFFILYNCILLVFPLKKINIYTNQERAEEFVYAKKKYSKVFAGSGLIGGFSATAIRRDDFFNFYLPYNGSCSAVKIVALSGKIPKILFVETNCIFKGFDDALIDRLFDKRRYKLRFCLPYLLQKHKLIPLTKELIKPAKTILIESSPLPKPLFSQTLENQKKVYNSLPDIDKFNQCINELKKYIYYISSKGCEVIFFEMPIDKQLQNSPLANFQRNVMKDVFNDHQFKWIEPVQNTQYMTGDGIHLLEESTIAYFKYLESKSIDPLTTTGEQKIKISG